MTGDLSWTCSRNGQLTKTPLCTYYPVLWSVNQWRRFQDLSRLNIAKWEGVLIIQLISGRGTGGGTVGPSVGMVKVTEKVGTIVVWTHVRRNQSPLVRWQRQTLSRLTRGSCISKQRTFYRLVSQGVYGGHSHRFIRIPGGQILTLSVSIYTKCLKTSIVFNLSYRVFCPHPESKVN